MCTYLFKLSNGCDNIVSVAICIEPYGLCPDSMLSRLSIWLPAPYWLFLGV